MRLVGIARALVGQTDRRVLVQRTIVSDDQGAFGRIDDLDAFEIEIEGRRRVRVELSKEARIEPLATKKKKWGDLEDDPSFASIKDRGPGPHVTVTVKRSAIEEGDRIALSGDEKEFFFEADFRRIVQEKKAVKRALLPMVHHEGTHAPLSASV